MLSSIFVLDAGTDLGVFTKMSITVLLIQNISSRERMLPPPLHVKKKEKPIHLPEAPQQFFSIIDSSHMVANRKNLKKAFGVLIEILLLLVTNEHPTPLRHQHV
ncbi:hypothetical protein L2E82_49571 [Cichorium intybus]|uniref:Uncharacterized protein n=1 Tax=Cichorium intybus TaxID=13427 RepID=A0ACB8Z4Z6_CICIN|nr:hypothetical protein L2E82_49571 [Cichorium intybus]